MVNRPLPAIPSDSSEPSPGKHSSQHMNGHRKRTPAHHGHRPHNSTIHNGHSPNRRSVDDDIVPVTRRQKDHMSRSPQRRPQRPMSEVFSDHRLASSREFKFDDLGCYMYSRSQMQFTQQCVSSQVQVPNDGHVKGQGHLVLRYQNDSPFQETGAYENPTDDYGPRSNAPGWVYYYNNRYCKSSFFRWGKFCEKCWQDFSRGDNFQDTTQQGFFYVHFMAEIRLYSQWQIISFSQFLSQNSQFQR